VPQIDPKQEAAEPAKVAEPAVESKSEAIEPAKAVEPEA